MFYSEVEIVLLEEVTGNDGNEMNVSLKLDFCRKTEIFPEKPWTIFHC